MTDKYDFVQRDDMVMTSVKFRTIRKHKNYKKGDKLSCIIFGIDAERERISLKLSA